MENTLSDADSVVSTFASPVPARVMPTFAFIERSLQSICRTWQEVKRNKGDDRKHVCRIGSVRCESFRIRPGYAPGLHRRTAARTSERARGEGRTHQLALGAANVHLLRKPGMNDFRGMLMDYCMDEDDCRAVDCSAVMCSDRSPSVFDAFLQSDFCLQPKGNGMTRRSRHVQMREKLIDLMPKMFTPVGKKAREDADDYEIIEIEGSQIANRKSHLLFGATDYYENSKSLTQLSNRKSPFSVIPHSYSN
nr:xyloglucan galactosyltransferase XLT2-like [Ipomoea batatas]